LYATSRIAATLEFVAMSAGCCCKLRNGIYNFSRSILFQHLADGIDPLICRFYTVFDPEMNTNFGLSIKFELKLNSDMKNLMLVIAIMFAAFQTNGQQIKPSSSG
jgi:hypothetical protein